MKKIIITLILFCSLSLLSFAQEEKGAKELKVVTMEEAVEMALKNNLSLKSQSIDLKGKKRAKNSVANQLYPSISAGAGLTHMWEKRDNSFQMPDGMGGMTTISLGPGVPDWAVGFSLDISLYLNGAIFEGIRTARLDYESGQLTYLQAEKSLIKEVKKAFYNLLLLQDSIELMQEQIRNARSRYEQALTNYRNGLVPQLSVLGAQVALENLKPVLKDMEMGYRLALNGLAIQLGLNRHVKLEIKGEVEMEPISLDAEELIKNHLSERLDLKGLHTAIELQKSARRVAILAGMTPSIILNMKFDPSFSKHAFENSWFEDIENDWSQQSGMFMLGINVPLDCFIPFSKTWNDIKSQQEGIEKTKLALEQAIRGAETEIESLVLRLDKSLSSVEAMQANYELAQRSYNLTSEAYRQGSAELLEVEDAETKMNEARLNLAKEKLNYNLVLLDLEYALNTNIQKLKGESK